MIQELLSDFPMPRLPAVGLALFFVVFMGAILWVFQRSRRAIYERMKQLPLEEDR